MHFTELVNMLLGAFNVVFGRNGYYSRGSNNIGMGFAALGMSANATITGSKAYIGNSSQYNFRSGSDNVGVGLSSGYYAFDGSNNVWIGRDVDIMLQVPTTHS